MDEIAALLLSMIRINMMTTIQARVAVRQLTVKRTLTREESMKIARSTLAVAAEFIPAGFAEEFQKEADRTLERLVDAILAAERDSPN